MTARWEWAPPAYLVGAGFLLLGQGAAGLLVRASGRDAHAVSGALSDPLHASVHVVWGAAMLAVVFRGGGDVQERTLLVFGAFYVAFLVLGLVVHHPLGMRIDGGENAFHAVVGPVAIAVWAAAVRDRRRRAGPPRTESC